MNWKQLTGTALVASALSVAAMPSHAALVTDSFTGNLTFLEIANPFGLNAGDTISLDVMYDDSVITGAADEDFSVSNYADWDFTITIGTFSFSQADVNDPSYTNFWFDGGDFDGIEFYLEDVTVNGTPNILIEDYAQSRSIFGETFPVASTVYFEADWDFTSGSVTPYVPPTTPGGPGATVPEPAPFLLVAAGLLGLGLTRRKSKQTRVISA